MCAPRGAEPSGAPLESTGEGAPAVGRPDPQAPTNRAVPTTKAVRAPSHPNPRRTGCRSAERSDEVRRPARGPEPWVPEGRALRVGPANGRCIVARGARRCSPPTRARSRAPDGEYPQRMGRATVTVLLLSVVGGSLLGGCGSGQTKTVSVSSGAPGDTGTGAGGSPAPATVPVPTTHASRPKAPGQEGVRTSTGPASAAPGVTSGGLSRAQSVVRARGYEPVGSAGYASAQTLQVLVGARPGAQQAFFFVNGRYLGTDTSQPSGQVSVVAHGDTDVTLSYGLYRPRDATCCPSGGRSQVRYQLDNGRLAPQNPIPSGATSVPLSRR